MELRHLRAEAATSVAESTRCANFYILLDMPMSRLGWRSMYQMKPRPTKACSTREVIDKERFSYASPLWTVMRSTTACFGRWRVGVHGYYSIIVLLHVLPSLCCQYG